MRKRNAILILLLVVSLLPYFIICFYALPFADDFCFGWTSSENTSYIQKFLIQYLFWNGRYTADVLVNLHPITSGKLLMYQLPLFASLLATPLILFIFIRQLIKDVSTSVVIALYITLFYLCYQPDITEGVYWYIGIANYHLGNLCFLLHLTLLLLSFSARSLIKAILLFTSIILLIIAIGFNEVGAALIQVFYLLLAFNYQPRRSSQTDLKLVITLSFIVFLSTAFVFLSPGNFTRENEFSNQHHLFHSLLYSSLQTIRFIGKWSLTIPFIGLSCIVIAKADHIHIPYLRKFNYKIILALLLFTVFMGSFMPYFATGILGQHRTINYVFFYFILLWLWFLISISHEFLLYQKLSGFAGNNKIFFLGVISIAVTGISGNGRNILKDFENHSWKAYQVEFLKRQDQIIRNPALPVAVLKNIPCTFRITDAKGDSSWWVDKCMKNFYTGTGIELR